MTDWEAYDRLVAEQEAEAEARRQSPEGQGYWAEQKRRADFIHNYIDQADDHARGYYTGLVVGLVYGVQFAKSDVYGVVIDPEDLGYAYSPSGQQKHAESFYAPQPKAAPDLVVHTFDPVLFLCMANEFDDYGLIAWNFDLLTTSFGGPVKSYSLKIITACTESDTGVPDDFDWWYPWEERTAQLRDQIKAIVNEE